MTAKAWQTRPSALLGLEDDVIAYAIDEALAIRELASQQRPSQLPPGMRYESVADVPRHGPVVPGPYAHLTGAAHA